LRRRVIESNWPVSMGLKVLADGYMKAKKKPSAAVLTKSVELDPGNKELEQRLAGAH